MNRADLNKLSVDKVVNIAVERGQEIERLRKALQFYAEPGNWNEDHQCGEQVAPGVEEMDEGWVAREALGMEPVHPRNRHDDE